MSQDFLECPFSVHRAASRAVIPMEEQRFFGSGGVGDACTDSPSPTCSPTDSYIHVAFPTDSLEFKADEGRCHWCCQIPHMFLSTRGSSVTHKAMDG